MEAIIPKITGLLSFNYNDVEEIGIVGRGSFGVVLKIKHRSPVNDEEAGCYQKLVDSDDNSYDQEFVKDARILHSIQQENIMRFKAFCQRPCAIILEYFHFYFAVFSDDCNKLLHSLREFLAFVDSQQVLENTETSRRLPRTWPVDCSTFTVRTLYTET